MEKIPATVLFCTFNDYTSSMFSKMSTPISKESNCFHQPLLYRAESAIRHQIRFGMDIMSCIPRLVEIKHLSASMVTSPPGSSRGP